MAILEKKIYGSRLFPISPCELYGLQFDQPNDQEHSPQKHPVLGKKEDLNLSLSFQFSLIFGSKFLQHL